MVKIKYRQCIPVIGKLKAQRCSKFNADNLKNGITTQEYKTKAEDLLETLPDAKYQNVETAWGKYQTSNMQSSRIYFRI
jgi:hypothetical protein